MGIFDRLTERFEGFLDDVFIPEGLRSLLERASRLMERGNYDQALDLLRRAEREFSGHHRTFHLLGLCHFYRKDFEHALQALEHAVELREEPATHFYAGLAAEQFGAPQEAKLHFQTALGLAEETPFEFDLHFGLGRVLLSMGRTGRAVHELEKARRISDEDPELAVTLARALVEDGKRTRATELLGELSDEAMGVDGLRLKARLLEAQKPDAAAEFYEQIIASRPDDVGAMLGASRAHLTAGSPAKAQQYLLQTLEEAELPEQRQEAHTLLGRGHEKVGSFERALEQYRAALDIDVSDAGTSDIRSRARLGAGRALLELGRVDEAADYFEELTTVSSPYVDRARLGMARCRLQQEQLSEARRLLEEIDEPDAMRGEVEHVAGRIALASGDAAEALVSLQNALHAADSPTLRSRIESDRATALEKLTPDWALPDSLAGPVAVESVLGQLRGFLDTAPALESFQGPVRELEDTMTDPLSVAIVGEFNAGKSTLVNALVGEEVVPMGVLPTTAHTCFIRYGPRKTARVVYKSSDASEGETVEVDFAEARRRMEEETDRIEHLEFLYPHPQLRSIHFWDTPGFNALEEGHDTIASRALDEAEAILWVFDAKQTLSQTELDRLREIPDSAERLVVLLNKSDQLRAEEIEEIETYVEEQIGAMTAGSFAVSARDALAATSPGEAPQSENDGDTRRAFDEFRDFLDQMFVQRAGRIKTLEARRRLRQIVDELDQDIRQMVARREDLLEELGEIREWIDRAREERPPRLAEREADSVDDQFKFAVRAVAREMNEGLRPKGTFFSKMVLDAEDRAFALQMFQNRLDDVLDRSESRVREEVARVEAALTGRIGSIVDRLSVANARSLNRRLDGFYDEIRAMLLLLEERVYGQLAARTHGAVEKGGEAALESADPADDQQRVEAWREALEELLPEARDHVDQQLTGWYTEFFLVARRFSDRVHRDLQLLKLEAEYRYDISRLRNLITTP